GGGTPELPSAVEVAASSRGVNRYEKRRPQSPSGHDDGSKGTRLALGKPKRVVRLIGRATLPRSFVAEAATTHPRATSNRQLPRPGFPGRRCPRSRPPEYRRV